MACACGKLRPAAAGADSRDRAAKRSHAYDNNDAAMLPADGSPHDNSPASKRLREDDDFFPPAP